MDENLAYTIAVTGALVAVSIVAVIGPWIEYKRRAIVRAFARERGFYFSAREESGLWKRIIDALGAIDYLFGRVKNVIRGTWRGREVIGFDLSWRQPRAAPSRRRGVLRRPGEDNHLSICLCRLDADFPALHLTEKGFLGRFLDGLRANPAFLPAEFAERVEVVCRDQDFAEKLLHPKMIDWLMSHPGWRITLTGDLLFVFDGNRWPPEEYIEALDAAADFLDLIPAAVWEEYRGSQAAG